MCLTRGNVREYFALFIVKVTLLINNGGVRYSDNSKEVASRRVIVRCGNIEKYR